MTTISAKLNDFQNRSRTKFTSTKLLLKAIFQTL